MLVYEDNNLHFLVEKYQTDSTLKGVINNYLKGNEYFLNTNCSNCLNQKTLLPDQKALDKWSERGNRFYTKSITKLNTIKTKITSNSDVFALLAYGYSELEDYKTAVINMQKAVEFNMKEKRFLEELYRYREGLIYKVFQNSPEGKKFSKWHGRYYKSKYLKYGKI